MNNIRNFIFISTILIVITLSVVLTHHYTDNFRYLGVKTNQKQLPHLDTKFPIQPTSQPIANTKHDESYYWIYAISSRY